MLRWVACAAVLGLLVLSDTRSGARAEDGAGPQALHGEALRHQVAKWVEDLRADDFEVRERARASLKRYAQPAREWIEAASDDPDPEVRRTLLGLIANAPKKAPTVRVGNFSTLLMVSIDAQAVPAGKAFADFGRRFGGAFVLPSSSEDVPVTVSVQDVPYFNGLRALLQAAALQMPRSFDHTGTAKLVPADKDAARLPSVAVGPFWIRLVSRQTTVQFGAATATPAYAFTVEAWWPPSLQMNQLRAPNVEIARDENGVAMVGSNRGTRYGLSSTTYFRRLDVTLRPSKSEHGRRLSVLEFSIPMRLRHGRVSRSTTRTAELPVQLGPKGTPVAALDQDGSVAFRSLKRQDNNTRTWVAEVSAMLSEEMSRDSAQVSLETSTGRQVTMHLATGRSESADGILNLTVRAWNVGAERPRSLTLHWFTVEEEGSVRVRFEDIALR